MKTEADILAEIAGQKVVVETAREALKSAAKDKGKAPAVYKYAAIEKKKQEAKLRFLREILPYVRSAPRPEFLETQIKKLGGKFLPLSGHIVRSILIPTIRSTGSATRRNTDCR